MMLVMEAFRRTADFKGRSSRDEFVTFFGAIVVVLVVLNVLAGKQYGAAVFPMILLGLAICAIPALSLTVRRLHDQNREPRIVGAVGLVMIANKILQALLNSFQYTALGSFLQALVWGTGAAFFAGIAYILYLGFQPGDEGVNDYGPPPVQIAINDGIRTDTPSTVGSSPIAAQTANTNGDPLAQIERLSKLRDDGVLTEQEFSEQKAALLTRL